MMIDMRKLNTRRSRGLARLLVAGLLWLLLAAGAWAEDIGVTIARDYGYYPDFATDLRVQYVGNRLAQAAGLPNTTFTTFNDSELNAMALPDGRVFITSRMATQVTDDELAFVLGHELTHVREKHAQHQQDRVTGGAILGAILVGVLGGSDESIRMGADIAGSLTYGHYSQKDEYKADAGGIALMTRCGYTPKKAADAMQRLLDLYGRGDASTPVLGWFASHPDTKKRKQRLLAAAEKLEANPPARLPDPAGVEIALDPSAGHAAGWAQSYFSILVNGLSFGRAVALTSPRYPAPPLPAALVPKPKEDKNAKKSDAKNEPLPAVVFIPPAVPVAYRVTLALRPVPAGRAATPDAAEGTAVEAVLRWTAVETGFTSECAAVAQTRKRVPWEAGQELARPELQYGLADGKADNVEGTLEAIALRRVARAFAEVVEAKGFVDHGTKVTLPVGTDKLRPGDYVTVYRGSAPVAEVCIDAVTGRKSATGAVLWGTHAWKKKDKFIAE